MMQSPNEAEYFLFENRQHGKWDAALPGHGMVITRVDLSNQRAWWNNDVNSDPSHNYYEIIRASGADAADVPFPGNHNVTYINSSSDPALLPWTGEACPLALNNISEDNSVITFNVVNDVPPLTIVEDFEQMPASLPANATNVRGNFATWNFPKANVVEHNGGHAASLQMPAAITMNSDINVQPIKLSLEATNTASTVSKLQLFYSVDQGATWNSIGTENVTASSSETVTWRINLDKQPMRFRINRTSGSKSVNLIIDNITIHYFDNDAPMPGDVNGDHQVTAADITALYDYLLNNASTHLINGDQDKNGSITAADVTAVYSILLGN